jgi:hypothetical protein
VPISLINECNSETKQHRNRTNYHQFSEITSLSEQVNVPIKICSYRMAWQSGIVAELICCCGFVASHAHGVP